MNLNGSNKCNVCSKEIKWSAHIKEASIGAYTGGSESLAEAIAVGRISTTQGLKTQFEIVVECPHCHNKNKYACLG